MDDLLAEFIAETRETLETIASEIVVWETQPQDRTRLDAIFRFVHTVKGSAGFLELPQLQHLSHEAETALSDLRDGKRVPDPALIDAILAIVDRIGETMNALEAGEDIDHEGDEALIAALAEDASRKGDEIAPGRKTAARSTPARSIRVPVELLDRLMGGVSDLVLARNELARQLRRSSGDREIDGAFDRVTNCVAEMRETITWARMQRIEALFASLPRIVRDISAELGKQVALEIDGDDVELDREMIEMLRDPLIHIVRNAVDHGIAKPEQRVADGKPAIGTLSISARQSGNQILVAIADDGCGIDTGRLIAKAVSEGAIDASQVSSLDERDTLDLVFHPGLSTVEEVSAVSGRGVGMDVVRSNVERIGGSIDIESASGEGTSFILRVPLTLTIIPALVVAVGNEMFALPRAAIEEIISLTKGSVRLEAIGGTEIAAIRGERIPVARLGKLLERDTDGSGDRIAIILRATRSERFALTVSEVMDHEELVVRPAPAGIMQSGIYAGTALPDNGRPLLLLDVAGIADRAGLRLSMARQDRMHEPEPAQKQGIAALVFDDLDGKRRAVRMGIVERIIDTDARAISESAGVTCLVLDNEILPVLASGTVPESGTLRVLRLSDGGTAIVYPIAGEVDVVTLPDRIEAPGGPGHIAGVVLVDGLPVELLDAHRLFAGHRRDDIPDGEKPSCLILGGDRRWNTEVLGPLVEMAGYAVSFDETTDPRAMDVVIEADGGGGQSIEDAVNVVRLEPLPGSQSGGIYRYDRRGIYAALKEKLAAGGRS